MSLLEALVLGLVQGLTEFLPISSSGHLVIVPALFGWNAPSVAYDAMLHGASVLAALIYFKREIFETLDGLGRPGPARKFAGLLIVGTIPAAVIGISFESWFEKFFQDAPSAARALIVTGVILVVSETIARRKGTTEEMDQPLFTPVEKISVEVGPLRSFLIGCAQAVAILPGISRSGTTIGAGLLVGLSRPQAARFSFMLAIPILVGTGFAEIPELGNELIGVWPIVIGAVACFISSYLAIAGMIGYLQKRGLYPFAAYCFVAGGLVSLVLARS